MIPLESLDQMRLQAKPERRQPHDRRLAPRGGRRASDDQRSSAPSPWRHDAGPGASSGTRFSAPVDVR
jgi:hypothetical protein